MAFFYVLFATILSVNFRVYMICSGNSIFSQHGKQYQSQKTTSFFQLGWAFFILVIPFSMTDKK